MISAVVQAVQIPVIAGAGSNDTRSCRRNAERCAEVGVAGILDVTPYYNRPSQAGLIEHFRTTAAATDLPVMLYDIPPRSGRNIDNRHDPEARRRGRQHRGRKGRRR
jgi:4-hydroxy-tetrahydrodipicolinate synthase